jgi:hypothetical protein
MMRVLNAILAWCGVKEAKPAWLESQLMALRGVGPNIAKMARDKGLVYRHNGTLCVWTGAAESSVVDPYWWNPDNWRDGHIPLLGDSVCAVGETSGPWWPVGIAWEDTLIVSARDYTLLGYRKNAPEWAKVTRCES